MKRRIFVFRALLLATISVGIIGCLNFAPVIPRNDLYKLVEEMQGNSFPPTLYYMGSDASYDYYAIDYTPGPRPSPINYYRVVRDQHGEADPMPYTKDSSRWRAVAGLKSWHLDSTSIQDAPGTRSTSQPWIIKIQPPATQP